MDSQGLAVAAALLAFFSGMGAAIDNLVMPHQNSKLQDRLIRYWDYVDDVKFRDVAQTMVALYLRAERKLLGPFPSWRWICTTLISSAVVTSVILVFGRTLGVYLALLCGETLDSYGNRLEAFFVMLGPGWNYFVYNVNHSVVYALNITFDVATLTTTLLFLRLYISRRSLLPRYLLVLADIAVCTTLLYTCMFIAFYADTTTSGIKSTYWTFHEQLLEPLRQPQCGHFHVFTSTLLFSSTVLIPTLTYLTAIFLFLNAKLALEAARWIVAHVLELGATQKKTVFFYSGVYLGILSSVMKLVVELGKALAS